MLLCRLALEKTLEWLLSCWARGGVDDVFFLSSKHWLQSAPLPVIEATALRFSARLPLSMAMLSTIASIATIARPEDELLSISRNEDKWCGASVRRGMTSSVLTKSEV